jgi:hypothetical protein
MCALVIIGSVFIIGTFNTIISMIATEAYRSYPENYLECWPLFSTCQSSVNDTIIVRRERENIWDNVFMNIFFLVFITEVLLTILILIIGLLHYSCIELSWRIRVYKLRGAARRGTNLIIEHPLNTSIDLLPSDLLPSDLLPPDLPPPYLTITHAQDSSKEELLPSYESAINSILNLETSLRI